MKNPEEKIQEKKEEIIDFNSIETKWQKEWEEKNIFHVEESKKKKYYVLEMYPYPSASGLHVGHAFNYVIGDIQSRFKRMQGFNVLHPMGFDSFGLPAENAAIKAKSHPKIFTEKAIASFINQQKKLGISYDWDRMIQSHNPDYYKWDQWIFLKLFERGMAYKKVSAVNWCPKCNTVLANEQINDGKCWRHPDTNIEIKHLDQWFFKITKYADELYESIENLKDWPDRIKTMQRNWIGKSYGTEILFEINNEKWPIFTTRPDTIFGVTFMVISSNHPRLKELVTKQQKKAVEEFLKKLKSTSEKDLKDINKEGVFTGSYAINPINNEKVPIYAGNFVIADYGAGMIMAVPAHDQRDFDFAKKYNIPIKQVIKTKKEINDIDKPYTENGILINSKEFNGLDNEKAKKSITEFLKSKNLAKEVVNFKLRDWLISRQRFWGTPIPIIYCDRCGIVPVPEKDLPVKLPEDIKFTSEKNPLIDNKSFFETTCPICGKKAKRETDTMDTFVNSSWYYLRYCDNKNNTKIFDGDKAKYWCPIDLYIGGAEHACMHLIYFRFYTKFLRDLGLIDFDEPTYHLFNQGMVHGEDGTVMSKSKGNVIDPLEVSDKYSADTLRIFLVSMASPDKDSAWSNTGIESMHKFIKRFFILPENIRLKNSSHKIESKINELIKEVSKDIETLQYNIAIIKLRKFLEIIDDEKEISKKDLESYIKLMSPFCPHIAEELWHKMGNKTFISKESWPITDESRIDERLEEQEKIVDKTVEDIINVLNILKEKQNKEADKIYVYVMPNELSNYNEEVMSRRVAKQVRVFAVNDKNKYDPEGKASKAKPGKPGIFAE